MRRSSPARFGCRTLYLSSRTSLGIGEGFSDGLSAIEASTPHQGNTQSFLSHRPRQRQAAPDDRADAVPAPRTARSGSAAAQRSASGPPIRPRDLNRAQHGGQWRPPSRLRLVDPRTGWRAAQRSPSVATSGPGRSSLIRHVEDRHPRRTARRYASGGPPSPGLARPPARAGQGAPRQPVLPRG